MRALPFCSMLGLFVLAACPSPSQPGTDAGTGSPSDAGGGNPISCAGSLTACSGECVDLSSDPQNCGSCGAPCASGAICSKGTCTSLPADCRQSPCPSGYYCDLNGGKCNVGCAADSQCPQPGSCDLASHQCSCAAGDHVCGSECVPSGSVASCGSSCSPCPTDPNGAATCDGTQCGIQCNGGFMLCGGACASCPADPGQAGTSCSGAQCVAASCNSGYHLCGGHCTSDNSPASCGSSCTACPGDPNGTTTCDGVSCGVSCNPGYHWCGSQCVSNNDPATCGSSCSACPADPNGTATCDGVSCGTSCNGGYAYCGNACAACPSSAGVASTACSGNACVVSGCFSGYLQCGNQCSSCPNAPFGATFTCDSQQQCVVAGCPQGYQFCGGACSACPSAPTWASFGCSAQNACVITDCGPGYALCGPSSCVSCPTGTSTGTCNGGSCVPSTCETGYHMCGGACASDSSTQTCGSSCTPCPSDPNGAAACNGTQCTLSCNSGYLDCGNACASCSKGSWGTTCQGSLCVPQNCLYGYRFCNNDTACCAWTLAWVDGNGVGFELSAAVDANGTYHVAYLDSAESQVKYAKGSGSSWSIQVLASGASSSFYNPSLALDPGGNPHVVYGTSAGLIHTWWTGSAWSTETVDATAPYAQTALGMDSLGEPVVVYAGNGGGGVKYAIHSGGAWRFTAVDSTSGGSYPRLALDSAGQAHVLYTNSTGHYAVGRPTFGADGGFLDAGWVYETAGCAGSNASLAIDKSGNPYCAEQVMASTGYEQVNVARRTGPNTWATSPVTGNNDWYDGPTSILVDPAGNVEMTYFWSSFGLAEYLTMAPDLSNMRGQSINDTSGSIYLGTAAQLLLDSTGNPKVFVHATGPDAGLVFAY